MTWFENPILLTTLAILAYLGILLLVEISWRSSRPSPLLRRRASGRIFVRGKKTASLWDQFVFSWSVELDGKPILPHNWCWYVGIEDEVITARNEDLGDLVWQSTDRIFGP